MDAFGIHAWHADRTRRHLPVTSCGNVYFNGAEAADCESAPVYAHAPAALDVVKTDDGYALRTDLYAHLPKTETRLIDSDTLGFTFEPEQRFEAPDGSAIRLDTDLRGLAHAASLLPGPFAVPLSGDFPLD